MIHIPLELLIEELLDFDQTGTSLDDFMALVNNKNRLIVTESDLKTFFRCPYGYFLKHCRGLTKIPRNAFAAQAMFFEQARKEFLNC